MIKGGVILAQNIICSNLCCKHHQEGDICGISGATMKIGAGARCQSFEKGLNYYFGLVWAALDRKNIINDIELTSDMKIGLYCVMAAYHLGFSTIEWGTCRMYALRAGEDSPMLKTVDIIALPVDKSAVEKMQRDLEAGVLANMGRTQIKRKKPSQPYGWLSPTGTFIEGDFAEHDAAARDIIRKNSFWEEFRSWRSECQGTCRDFLSQVKGYCLIHNPSGVGGYIVSAAKPLTKTQRNFLYGYFMDLGDRFKAEQFVSDGT